jgi:transmembrane sensor
VTASIHDFDTPRTAEEWFAARLGPRRSALETAFSAWLDADPKHRREYAACELAWGLVGEARITESPRRRPLAMGVAIASLAASLAAIAIGSWVFFRTPAPPLVFQTGPGEQRMVRLADGSQVTINTRSRLEVRIDRRHRGLRLLTGEAFFDVVKDAARPFIVATDLGIARAVGTRFNVLVENERVEVSTEEGKVLVQPPDATSGGVLATAGTRATLARGVLQATIDRADLNRIDNWLAHRLEFDRVPLSQVLAEFSRYTPLPIRAATPAVGAVSVSAVLKVGDIDALKATLDAAFGLDVVPQANEWVVTRR